MTRTILLYSVGVAAPAAAGRRNRRIAAFRLYSAIATTSFTN